MTFFQNILNNFEKHDAMTAIARILLLFQVSSIYTEPILEASPTILAASTPLRTQPIEEIPTRLTRIQFTVSPTIKLIGSGVL